MDSLDEVSEECKDLLRKILKIDGKKRATMQQILQHKWLQRPLSREGDFNLLATAKGIF